MGRRELEWWREGVSEEIDNAQGGYEDSDLQELVELQQRGRVGSTSAKQDYKTANWGKRIAVTAPVLLGEVLAEVQSSTPQPWTVTIGPGDPMHLPGPTPQVLADASDSYILLEYGVGGAAVKVEVDVATGWSCTVYGSFVRVSYFLPTFINLATSPPLSVAAFVCPGAQPRAQMLTRTVHYSDLLLATNETRGIPRFAEKVWFQAANLENTSQTVVLEQERLGFTQRIAALALVASQQPSAQLVGWPLSPDATSVEIRNTSTGTFIEPRLVYSLRF